LFATRKYLEEKVHNQESYKRDLNYGSEVYVHTATIKIIIKSGI
jgi:hypothetical protein